MRKEGWNEEKKRETREIVGRETSELYGCTGTGIIKGKSGMF